MRTMLNLIRGRGRMRDEHRAHLERMLGYLGKPEEAMREPIPVTLRRRDITERIEIVIAGLSPLARDPMVTSAMFTLREAAEEIRKLRGERKGG